MTENSLSQCISEIRKAIGDEKQSLLKTVARRGYRFVPETDAPGLPHDRCPPIFGTDPPEPHEGNGRLGQILVSVVPAIVAVVAAFIWRPTLDAEVPTSLSIAVLPFANLSEAEEQSYLPPSTLAPVTSSTPTATGLHNLFRDIDEWPTDY